MSFTIAMDLHRPRKDMKTAAAKVSNGVRRKLDRSEPPSRHPHDAGRRAVLHVLRIRGLRPARIDCPRTEESRSHRRGPRRHVGSLPRTDRALDAVDRGRQLATGTDIKA